MMAKILTSKKYTALLVLAVGFFASYQIFATVAEADRGTGQAPAQGITFPIPELGSCGSKEECLRYCNEADHMEACVKFGEEHGLMNKDEARQARKFREELFTGGGPGGCKSPDECQAFCSDIKNIEACVNFAKEHGFTDKHVDQGEKILAYVKAGGKLPGGCTSEESCKRYCSDFSHAEECFEFAKKAGIAQLRERAGGHGEELDEEDLPSNAQFQKFLELVRNGETPGGCRTKETCESYCGQEAHREECLAFGEKVGFIKHEQAERIRKDGFRGPGGCNSPDSCRDYCNDPAHREACFKFAEDHGFVSRGEITRVKEGLVRVQAGFEGAPEEVKACLKSVLGKDVIEDIQAGKLVPGPEIGEKVKDCFEKFHFNREDRKGGQGGPEPEKVMEFLRSAPPEVANCLKNKLGGGLVQIDASQLRECFEEFQLPQPLPVQGSSTMPNASSSQPAPFSPSVIECVRQRFGDAAAESLKSGAPPSDDLLSLVKQCRCLTRPACLDQAPRCLIPEPAGGWCPGPSPYHQPCTMEAKLCPSGSYVGRTGPNCEFAACPEAK